MTPSGIDPPEHGREEQERHEQVERVRRIEVVDLRLDHVRTGQLVLGVVDPGVDPALGHELVVVEVRADRSLAVDDPIEEDRLDGGERQDDDRQADPQRTQVATPSDDRGPVDAEGHHDGAEGDEREPAPPDPTLVDRGQPAQGDHERHRIEEVAVAVLEPPAAVVEQGRDEDGDGRAERATRSAAVASRPASRTGGPGW